MASLIGETRAQIQAKMIEGVSEAIASVSSQDEEVIINTVAMRFVESLSHMVSQSGLRERLPLEVVRAMDDLPQHIIGGDLEES